MPIHRKLEYVTLSNFYNLRRQSFLRTILSLKYFVTSLPLQLTKLFTNKKLFISYLLEFFLYH